MLRLAKSLQFFQQPDDLHAQAQTFIAPQGYSLIVGSNNHNVMPVYGPGSVFQGQVTLQLAKPIKGPCRLRVVFSCRQNLGPHPSVVSCTSSPLEELSSVATSSPSSYHASTITSPTTSVTSTSHSHHMGASIIRPFSSSSTGSRRNSRSLDSTCSASAGEHYEMLFDIEHVLLENQDMAIKRHLFMFTIKLPMCNFPPSFQDRDRSVVYSVHSDLTFMTQPEDPATRVTLQASPVQIKYVPMVPSSTVQFPVIEMGQGLEPYTNKPLYKATVESGQRGASPGESIPFRLTLANLSPTELYSIQIALVRTMTFYPEYAGRAAQANGAPTSQYSPESTIVDTITIPVTMTPNKGQTWAETIQYTIPSDSSLIPTTNKSVTSLFKVDYYIAISIPVASKSAGLGSWFTQGFKAPPPIDLSQVPASMSHATATATTTTTTTTAPTMDHHSSSGVATHRRTQSDHRLSKLTLQSITSDRVSSINTSGKWPTLIQLPLIPIIIGTVSSTISERQMRWPIPSYQDVMDRPCFVRDKFEEEMHRQLERMENLMMEEDDINIDDLVKAAQAQHKSDSSSGSEEDEQAGGEGGKHRSHRRAADRVPARFRSGMGLKTPPPSPPSSSPPLDNLMGAVASMHAGSASLSQTLPRSVARPKRSMSPKTVGGGGGLSKELLLEMHHKAQQQQYASMQ